MTDTTTIARPPVGRDYSRPRVPHTTHLKALKLVDGREIVIDRRCLGFLCPIKGSEDTQTIVGLKLAGAKPVPVIAPYADLKRWWFGETANGKERKA